MTTFRETGARRLRTALDLLEFGAEMMRQRLHRENPGAQEEEVGRRLAAWLQTRPGAEDGDAEGKRVPWPRPSR